MPYIYNNVRNSNIVDVYEYAIKLQKEGCLNKAVQAFEELIKNDPSFVEAYNSLGLTYKIAGKNEEARKAYNEGTEVLFQDIYNYAKNNPLQSISNDYVNIKSSIWRDVATEIAVKNAALDGLEKVKFPTGESALDMFEQNSFVGYVFFDKDSVRYILPAYFCAIYEALKNTHLYSILVNNAGVLYAESNHIDQAKRCFVESMEFIPGGVRYDNPRIGLEALL
jgi:tetratricopeptide (TPR) repeat protein